MKYLKNKKGYTLIELVVALSILGIIVIPISNMFMYSVKVNSDAEEKLKIAHAAQEYIESDEQSGSKSDGSIKVTTKKYYERSAEASEEEVEDKEVILAASNLEKTEYNVVLDEYGVRRDSVRDEVIEDKEENIAKIAYNIKNDMTLEISNNTNKIFKLILIEDYGKTATVKCTNGNIKVEKKKNLSKSKLNETTIYYNEKKINLNGKRNSETFEVYEINK